jgi:hypothetical protein
MEEEGVEAGLGGGCDVLGGVVADEAGLLGEDVEICEAGAHFREECGGGFGDAVLEGEEVEVRGEAVDFGAEEGEGVVLGVGEDAEVEAGVLEAGEGGECAFDPAGGVPAGVEFFDEGFGVGGWGEVEEVPPEVAEVDFGMGCCGGGVVVFDCLVEGGAGAC